MTGPIGFNNTYAVGMQRDRAEALGVRTISDLPRHPNLRFGFSNEFMDREDGWPGLRAHYRLPQTRVAGMEHDLAYRGLSTGAIDALFLYSLLPIVRNTATGLCEIPPPLRESAEARGLAGPGDPGAVRGGRTLSGAQGTAALGGPTPSAKPDHAPGGRPSIHFRPRADRIAS